MINSGANVVPLFDEFERGTPDPVWLPVVASRGWILLTKDDKWRYRHEEMMILIREVGVGLFKLPTRPPRS